MPNQAIAALRAQLTDTVAGTIFLFIGLLTFSIALLRHRSGVRVFVWLGLWSSLYGGLHITQSPLILSISAPWFRAVAPYANNALMYLVVVAGSLSFAQLSRGILQRFIQFLAGVGFAIAVIGFVYFVRTGIPDKVIPANNWVAAFILAALATSTVVPRFARKYLVLHRFAVLAVGSLIFSLEALYANLTRALGWNTPLIFDHIGFAILLFSFGYSALQLLFENERRLLSVEHELAIASEIQASILPSSVPTVDGLNISSAYRPMTAVAGDFFEFIPVDNTHLGILVADVSGHGVPAALIASMIKVAAQSVFNCANDPQAVLCGLNRALSGQLRGQFVSSAYLWLDTSTHTALYSAAGHPPLLLWRQGALHRIESNGLLFGVLPDADDYPVTTISFQPGDRFLLYTDGVTDPENSKGDSFGDLRLEQVVRDHQSRPASELSTQLLSAMRNWLPPSTTQQDDVTLIVVDVNLESRDSFPREDLLAVAK